MAKVLARLLMGVIFVFVTISAPVHAATSAQTSAAQAADMSGHDMSAMEPDCAKAMATAEQDDQPHKDGGCDDIGCTCPLSHCPSIAALTIFGTSAPLPYGRGPRLETSDQALPSYLSDTLTRPPRA